MRRKGPRQGRYSIQGAKVRNAAIVRARRLQSTHPMTDAAARTPSSLLDAGRCVRPAAARTARSVQERRTGAGPAGGDGAATGGRVVSVPRV